MYALAKPPAVRAPRVFRGSFRLGQILQLIHTATYTIPPSSFSPSLPLSLTPSSLSLLLSLSLYALLCVAPLHQTKKFYKLVKKAAKDKICRRGVKEVGGRAPILGSSVEP